MCFQIPHERAPGAARDYQGQLDSDLEKNISLGGAALFIQQQLRPGVEPRSVPADAPALCLGTPQAPPIPTHHRPFANAVTSVPRRSPPPWSIRRIRSVLPPSATTRFNPRANDVSDYGWGDGIGAGEDEGVTGLGLWAWAYQSY